MSVYLNLADLSSTSTEAYLDGETLVDVRTYDIVRGYVDIEYGEGEDRICRAVTPLRVVAIVEGSIAELVISQARKRFDVYAERIWNTSELL